MTTRAFYTVQYSKLRVHTTKSPRSSSDEECRPVKCQRREGGEPQAEPRWHRHAHGHWHTGTPSSYVPTVPMQRCTKMAPFGEISPACLPACLPATGYLTSKKSYISESESESEGSNLQITKFPRREQRERKKSLAMPATSIICKCLRLYCIIISVLGIKPPRGFRVPAPKLQLFSSYYPPPPPSVSRGVNKYSEYAVGGRVQLLQHSTTQHSTVQQVSYIRVQSPVIDGVRSFN